MSITRPTYVQERHCATKEDIRNVQLARLPAEAGTTRARVSIGRRTSCSTNRNIQAIRRGCWRDAADQNIRMVLSLKSIHVRHSTILKRSCLCNGE